MLQQALKARLPLIAVHTRDVVNFTEVVEHMTSKKPELYRPDKAVIHPETVHYYVHRKKLPVVLFGPLYGKLVAAEATLVVINPEYVEDEMFDAGEVPVPKTLVHKWLLSVTEDEALSQALVKTTGGITIKETVEYARLTQTRDHSMTPLGMLRTRKEFFPVQAGMALVDTNQALYVPHEKLKVWAANEKDFFLGDHDDRLRPRGLLFDGPPGVGKTAGAKYIASQWGIPLLKIDLGATKNKYVGESQANMRANLARLDDEEPAIVLFDEIEKNFGGTSDGDNSTTTDMLAQVLWWLAEHKSRVLTIMTTNNAGKLPKELYREGRINETIVFRGLDQKEAIEFAKQVMATFKLGSLAKLIDPKIIVMSASAHQKVSYSEEKLSVSHAAVTEATYSAIKKALREKA